MRSAALWLGASLAMWHSGAGQWAVAATAAPMKAASSVSPLSRAAGPSAIVVPRSSCGTSWTAWVKDPKADLNPCPKGCERGKRLQRDEHKSGDTTEYQANYECYLPQLAVPQPALKARATGAPPRQNCGTMWTGWQSDPSSPANPCPANCERGELRLVNRSLSNGKLVFDLNYQCYVKDPASAKLAAIPTKVIGTATIEITGPSTKVIRTAAIQITGPSTKVIRTAAIQITGPSTKVIRTLPIEITGAH